MRVIFVFCLLFLLSFLSTKSILADSPPDLLDPVNDSTITQTSPKLSWSYSGECYTSGSCFYVAIDDSESFTSIDKYTYTNNTYYTPQNLAPKKWFWKVKAKDPSGTWSNFSNVWSFTISSESSTPSPTPSSTASPTSIPTPAPSPTSSSTSSFIISNTPSQINSDQIFNVAVNLSLPNSPNTFFYLKGAFKKAGGSNYFGQTLVSGSWIKNGSTYSNQYPITTDSSGNWSGNMEIQPDSEDSGFEGSGDYIFKVGRYTQSGSGPTWSNEATIKIISTSSNDNADQGSSETSNTTSPQTTPATLKSKTQITTPPKKYGGLTYRTSSVAGETISSTSSATPSAEESTQVKERKFFNLNIWAILGSIFIIAGLGSIGFIYLRSKKIK